MYNELYPGKRFSPGGKTIVSARLTPKRNSMVIGIK